MPSKAVVDFRDASPADALNLITCGFELETQATTFRPATGPVLQLNPSQRIVSAEVDEERFQTAQRDAVRLACRDWNTLARNANLFPEGHWARRFTTGAQWEYLFTAFQFRADATLNALVEQGFLERGIFNTYKAAAEERANRSVSRDAFRRSEMPQQFLERQGMPAVLEAGVDGSVRGFEFRTRGPVDVATFDQCAGFILAAPMGHTIDTGCSFHVHVAVKGVEHRFGERFQVALTEYLLEKMPTLPATLRSRLATVESNRYFQPGVSEAKYSFVHRHPQGTWEFRCFGNITNVDDGKLCLRLAVAAMQYAYKVISGEATTICQAKGWNLTTWRDACMTAMRRGITLTQASERPELANAAGGDVF